MRTFRLVHALCAVTAALALLGAGCGDDSSTESQAKAAVAVSSQAYRDRLADIVIGPDDARGNYHDALLGEPTLAAARELARASREAAGKIEKLTPSAGLEDLNADLAKKYRVWASELDRALRRKPVSTARLGDAVREYGQAADVVYEQILIAP